MFNFFICLDLNECNLNTHNCHNDATCTIIKVLFNVHAIMVIMVMEHIVKVNTLI